MPLPTLSLELDTTGTSVANKQTNELHVAPTRSIRVIKPKFGAYFTESLQVFSKVGEVLTPLDRGTDFTCVELFTRLTAETGKEICGAILIHRPDLPNDFAITYQPLGGFDNVDFEGLAIAVRDLAANGQQVDWNDILDKPRGFPPRPGHLHDAKDLYGMEYLIDQVQALVGAIGKGNDVDNGILMEAGKIAQKNNRDAYQVLLGVLRSHIDNRNNPHGLTKGLVQLGSVENRGFVTKVVNGVTIEPYASPRTTRNKIRVAVLGDVFEHIDNKNNPHEVTKTQVGLSLVQNYPVANESQLVSGASAQFYVTPVVLAAVLTAILGVIITHAARTDDPHNTTKAQIGLSLVDNFPFANEVEVEVGNALQRFVAPADIASIILTMRTAQELAQTTHFENSASPHGETPAQIGLGEVINGRLATEAEVVERINLAVEPDPLEDDEVFHYLTPKLIHDATLVTFDNKLEDSAVGAPDGAVPLDGSGLIPAQYLQDQPGGYDFGAALYLPGPFVRDEMLWAYAFTRTVDFPSGMVESMAAAAIGPSTTGVTIELLKNGKIFASIVFNAFGDGTVPNTQGIFVGPGPGVTFLQGDLLNARVTKADAALTGLSLHLAGLFTDSPGTVEPAVVMPSTTTRPAAYIVFGPGYSAADDLDPTRSRYQISSATQLSGGATPSARTYVASFGNSQHGFNVNGRFNDLATGGTEECIFDSYTFAMSSLLTFGASRIQSVGFGNENMGIVFGGILENNTLTNQTYKYTHPTATAAAHATLGLAYCRTQGFGNHKDGYVRGGSSLLLETTGTTYFGKFNYASETMAALSTASAVARYSQTAVSNATLGVVSGGIHNANTVSTVERITFASNSIATGANLTAPRHSMGGGGDATTAVFAMGTDDSQLAYSTVQHYAYATDTSTAGGAVGSRKAVSALSSSPGWR